MNRMQAILQRHFPEACKFLLNEMRLRWVGDFGGRLSEWRSR